jgi:hypothetical protein
MDIEERIFTKLDQLHDEIHQCSIDIAEIKQWKKDLDEADADKQWGYEKLFGMGGIVFGITAILLTFI